MQRHDGSVVATAPGTDLKQSIINQVNLEEFVPGGRYMSNFRRLWRLNNLVSEDYRYLSI